VGRLRLPGIAQLVTLALALAWLLLIDFYALRIAGQRLATHPRALDFTVFWAAARAPLGAIYDAAELTRLQATGLGGLMPFAYPPTFLAVVAPLRLLPFWPAYLAWVGLGSLAYFAAAARLYSRQSLVLVTISPAFVMTAVAGQSSLLVAALVLGGFSLLRPRPAVAGALFAAAALIKPQTVVLLPFVLLAAREWRALGACLAVGVIAGLASVLALGAAPWAAWIGSLGGFLDVVRDGGSLAHGATPETLAMQLSLSAGPALALCAVLGAAGIAIALAAGLKRLEPRLMAPAVVACGLLVSPYGLRYDLAPLLPLAASLLTDRRLTLWVGLGVIALSYYFLNPITVIGVASYIAVALAEPRQLSLPGAAPRTTSARRGARVAGVETLDSQAAGGVPLAEAPSTPCRGELAD